MILHTASFRSGEFAGEFVRSKIYLRISQLDLRALASFGLSSVLCSEVSEDCGSKIWVGAGD